VDAGVGRWVPDVLVLVDAAGAGGYRQMLVVTALVDVGGCLLVPVGAGGYWWVMMDVSGC
jgi:hypothetical protein